MSSLCIHFLFSVVFSMISFFIYLPKNFVTCQEREKTFILTSASDLHVNFASLAIQNAFSEDSDQTARMRSLIRTLTERTCPEVCFLT